MSSEAGAHRTEAALLGSLIIDPERVGAIAEIVRPEDFVSRRLRLVYEAQLACHARRVPPDYVLLCAELEDRGTMAEVGGDGLLTALINYSPTALHAEHYARAVAAAGQARRVGYRVPVGGGGVVE